jgi:hypothetical protein
MSELRTASVANLAGTGPVDLVGQAANSTWVNYTMVSSVSVANSLNVSSVTDNSTGNATTHFTTNYAAQDYGVQQGAGNTQAYLLDAGWLVGGSQLLVYNLSNTLVDVEINSLCMQGDLA